MVDQIESKFSLVASKLLNIYHPEAKEMDIIHRFYVGEKSRSNEPMEKFRNYTNLFSDR
jgi:hypothetical protein